MRLEGAARGGYLACVGCCGQRHIKYVSSSNSVTFTTLPFPVSGHIVSGHNYLDAGLDNLHIVDSRGFNHTTYQVRGVWPPPLCTERSSLCLCLN